MRNAVGKAETKVAKAETMTLYQLKITLDDVRPPIWRRVLLPADTPLPTLHHLIQTVMGWEDAHLHAFRVGETAYGQPDPDFDHWMQSEARIRLAQIAPAVKSKFRYEYDFGDDWQHTVVVEKILPAEAGQAYPLCLTGKRACPPEDCGGPGGYAELLEAISDPEHKEHEDTEHEDTEHEDTEHEEMRDWVGEEFDPEAFDLAAVNAELRRRRL